MYQNTSFQYAAEAHNLKKETLRPLMSKCRFLLYLKLILGHQVIPFFILFMRCYIKCNKTFFQHLKHKSFSSTHLIEKYILNLKNYSCFQLCWGNIINLESGWKSVQENWNFMVSDQKNHLKSMFGIDLACFLKSHILNGWKVNILCRIDEQILIWFLPELNLYNDSLKINITIWLDFWLKTINNSD